MVYKFCMSLISLLTLASCTTIEQRNEEVKRLPLAPYHNEIKISQLWSRQAGHGSLSEVPLHLSHQNGQLVIADKQGRLIDLDHQGRTQWSLKLAQGITAGPSVSAGNVVVGLDNASLQAHSLKTGQRLWTHSLSSEILAAPAIVKGQVYVHTLEGGLSAFDLASGHPSWKVNLDAPTLQLRRGAKPLVVHDQLIAAFANGRVASLQTYNGALNWQQEIAIPKGTSDLQRMVDISSDPVASNQHLFVVGYHGPLTALNLESGDKIWQLNLSSYTGICLSNHHLYLSDPEGDVWAVSAQQGATTWQQKALHGRRLTRPVQQGNYLLVGDDEGYVHWLERRTGQIKGRLFVDKHGIDTPPLVEGSTLFVLSTRGKVTAYQIEKAD